MQMKKILKKVGWILMAASFMAKLAACSLLNDKNVESACKALQEKYGESFTVSAVGDRMGTNHVKLVVCPEGDQGVLFTVTLDRESGTITDDYIVQKVNHMVDLAVENCGRGLGMELTSICMLYADETPETEVRDWTPESFLESNGLDRYSVFLLVDKSTFHAEQLHRVLETVANSLQVDLTFRIYLLEAENYTQCVERVSQNPDANPTTIAKYSPVCDFVVKVNDGVCSMTAEDMGRETEGA